MRFSIALFSLFLLLSCGQEEPEKKPQLTKQQMKDLSVQMNAWDKKRQHDEIEQYISNQGWKMEQTASGLRYMLLKEGKGDKAVPGQTARVEYRITLMDGTVCYSSEQDGAKDFLIGKDNVETGLHEGLQLMRKGDKMRFILPSHLAHGLTGDNQKIPPRSTVIYEIELLELR